MLNAFFDEKKDDPRIFLMGGFMGRAEEWEKLSDEWVECLSHSPQIDYFKSSECQTLNEQFWQCDRIKAERKKLELAKVIAKYPKITAFCISVPMVMFGQRNSRISRRAQQSRPYDYAFITTLSATLRYAIKEFSGEDKVDFVFDQCSELKGCLNLFDRLKEDEFFDRHMMYRAGICRDGVSKDLPALQMADLLLGEVQESLLTGESSEACKAIEDSNRILFFDGCPPKHLPGIFVALNHYDRWEREYNGVRTWLHTQEYTDEEATARIEKVLALKEAFSVAWERSKKLLNSDPEVQEFDRIYPISKDTAEDEDE